MPEKRYYSFIYIARSLRSERNEARTRHSVEARRKNHNIKLNNRNKPKIKVMRISYQCRIISCTLVQRPCSPMQRGGGGKNMRNHQIYPIGFSFSN